MINSSRLMSTLAGSGLVAALCVMPAIASANGAGTGTSPVILTQAEQFDDATIEAFVAARTRLAEIQALYTAQFEAAQTDEQRLQISEAASQEMVAAVEETPNITLKEYNAVIDAVSEDPALLERINEAIANPDT